MAALPYQFTAPRRKVLGSVWRSATCVALAITGLMTAAMTWTPAPTAACAGVSSSHAASSSAACHATLTSFGSYADAMGVNDFPRVHHLSAQAQGTAHATQKTASTSQSTPTTANGSGSGTSSGSGSPTYPPATGGLPCQQSYMFVSNISEWTVPPGCYANIYYPNRNVYHAAGNFGYCNWWVLALHPNQPDILSGSEYTRTSTPIPGAAIWFDPNVQGASSDGHWAEAVAVSPDHYWVLITEMNFSWRGGGWGRVDFRYIHVGPGVVFIH